MRKLLSILVLLLLSACASSNLACTQLGEPDLNVLRSSVVLISNKTLETNCGEDCTTFSHSSGTGFSVGQGINSTYIMTAGHVCAPNEPPLVWAGIYLLYEKEVAQKITVTTISGIKMPAQVVSYLHDANNDVCLMEVANLYMTPLRWSPHEPVPGSKAFNIAAPGGVFGNGTVPIFNARFSGQSAIKGDSKNYLFTMTVHPGSSGSPILNIDGEIIGVVVRKYGFSNGMAIAVPGMVAFLYYAEHSM